LDNVDTIRWQTNLAKKYGYLDDNKMRYLERLDRKRRHIQIGLYKRDDKEISKKENGALVEMRKWFFEQNGLQEEDILSIKRDAIFTLKRCHVTENDNIQFVEKNIYTSYYHLNNYEFFYNNELIHVKGIDDEMLELHKEYMLDFLQMAPQGSQD
jgi:DNA polymerase III epsilon subunit-like protein